MIRKHLDKAAELAKVKRIRVHDLRHSHVSYLISLGFTIFEIADRIGDTPTVVEMIYAHMYEGKRVEIAQKMQEKHQNSAS
jgi:integrase